MSFIEFFLIIAVLLATLFLAAVVVARRTKPQAPLRHSTSIGTFEPGLFGNLDERLDHASQGRTAAVQWVEAFLRHAAGEAVALRHNIPLADGTRMVDDGAIDDLPEDVASYLALESVAKRWKRRRRRGIRPETPRQFNLVRLVVPWHVSFQELFLQDVEQVLGQLHEYARGVD